MGGIAFDPSGPATGEGIFGLDHTPEAARVVLVPAPWEATTSYGRGTARGPEAILRASMQVNLYDRENGRPYEAGIAMLPPDPEIARWSEEASARALEVIEGASSGSLARVNELTALLNARIDREVGRWLDQGKLVGLVGGDHGSAFGCIAAHAARHAGMGILHVDAHADLRVAYQGFVDSHASIMHRVTSALGGVEKLVSVGLRDVSEAECDTIAASGGRIVGYFDGDLAARSLGGEPFAKVAAEIVENLPERVYVSFDIDGLDPTHCPHTGTPVPGGLTFREALYLCATVVKSGRRIVGFDLVEVAPGPDGDEWDANVGARLLYKLIGYALQSAERV